VQAEGLRDGGERRLHCVENARTKRSCGEIRSFWTPISRDQRKLIRKVRLLVSHIDIMFSLEDGSYIDNQKRMHTES